MKRYPKSTPDEPISVERISGVEMVNPIRMMPGENVAVRMTLSRLKDDPEVVVWSCARVIYEEGP